MNGELLTAVHVHVAALVPTVTVTVSPPPFALALFDPMAKAHGAVVVVVVVVVVAGDGVVESLEHAPANITTTSPMVATAVENFRWAVRIGRIF
jgi:hypothetical protein